MPDYIVHHWGAAGVIMRYEGSELNVVGYLHCTQEEARQIARDLGTELRTGYAGEEGSDCPLNCAHADEWKYSL